MVLFRVRADKALFLVYHRTVPHVLGKGRDLGLPGRTAGGPMLAPAAKCCDVSLGDQKPAEAGF